MADEKMTQKRQVQERLVRFFANALFTLIERLIGGAITLSPILVASPLGNYISRRYSDISTGVEEMQLLTNLFVLLCAVTAGLLFLFFYLAVLFNAKFLSFRRDDFVSACVAKFRLIPRIPNMNIYVKRISAAVALLVFLYFVWPTPYVYMTNLPLRVNRFTGEMQYTDGSGWKHRESGDEETPASASERGR